MKTKNGKVNRHKWRFSITRSSETFGTAEKEVRVLIRIHLGQTDASVAAAEHLTKGQVSHIVDKGGGRGIRKAFRNGETWQARAALRAAAPRTIIEISRKVTPKFI